MKPVVALAAIVIAGYIVFSCYRNSAATVDGGNSLNGRICLYFGAGAQ